MRAAAIPDVSLRPFTAADWPLLQRWLARPDIEAWWGPAASSEAGVRMALESRAALCRLVIADGEPVGYAHAVDATLWGEALPEGLPAGTWDIDIFIASGAFRGRGAGSAALEQLVAEVFSTTLAVAVCIFVSVRNERAVRAYEKAGFRWLGISRDPGLGPHWIMLRERPAR